MRDLKIYGSIAILMLVIYVVAQYNKPNPVNWSPTYLRTDKIPFGTYIAYQQLADIFPETAVANHTDPFFNLSKDSLLSPGSYIAIASNVSVDRYDFKEMLAYMKAGNDIFIASYYPGKFLSDTLGISINSEKAYSENDQIKIRFTNPSLIKKNFVFDKAIGHQYFSKFDTAKATVLGENEENHANFLRYDFGEGSLFLLPSPQFFTNYNMLKPGGPEYAAAALSYVSPGGKLVWSEHDTIGNQGDETSPMRVFFKYPALRWAYYIALFSMLIFVIYQIKRRQRIIPLLDPMQNSTVEFVKVVGQVYYQQRNNRNIAEKKITYFFEFLRSNYQIKTGLLDDDFRNALANKSGVDAILIEKLIVYIQHVRSGATVTDKQLIEMNKLIEHFY